MEKKQKLTNKGIDIYRRNVKIQKGDKKKVLKIRRDVTKRSQNILKKKEGYRGNKYKKTAPPLVSAKLMDSSKKKKCKRGTGLMPGRAQILVKRDTTPLVRKKIVTKNNDVVDINNISMNTSILSV